ncbi:MAG TPA: hypothetical protein PKE69_24955 [Pyrinomonadaceae bacterium]|nr:hypothetical protein [Pyrinomonadaceae bacterium]
MKLRIRENSVRLRLTQSEVAEFGENGLIENKTDFGETVFIYAFKSSDLIENLQANFESGRIEIVVPKAVAENWINTQEVGISGEFEKLKILIEKDFVCLSVREGEDESDAFPHPKEQEFNC